MQTGLTEFQEQQVKKVMRRMAKALSFAFAGKSDIYIGFYALLTAQTFISRYFDEDCASKEEFTQIKKSLIANISQFQKNLFAMNYKGDKHE